MCRRRRPPAPCAGGHRHPGPVLPRALLAAHARLGAAGVGQGRRRVHRRAHRGGRRVQDAAGRPSTARRTRPHGPDNGRRRRDLTMHTHSHTHHTIRHFPTDTTGLEAGTPPEIVDIPDGGAFDLRIAPVAKRLGDATVRMLAYNGSVPGPTLKVAQGSEVIVNVENRGDLEATVHWHGLRLDNRYDGTHETQRPMEVGESFQYRLQFPDEGLYWF